jgi:hypothetical protein
VPESTHAQTNFTGGELSDRLRARSDLAKYSNGLVTAENILVHPLGGVTRRPGSRFIVEVKDSAALTRLIPFVFSTTQSYILEFGDLYFRVFRDEGDASTEVVTPWTTAQVAELKHTQSADVLYVCNPTKRPQQVSRTSDTAWTVADYDYEDGPYLDVNETTTTLTLGGTTGSVSVTASAIVGINGGDGFKPADVDRLIRWKDSSNDWTWLQITAYTSTTVVTALIRGADAAATTATVQWRLGAWSDTTGWPHAVTFHRSRLVFGGHNSLVDTLWFTRTGDYTNHSPSDPDETVVDDHGIVRALGEDQVNAIRWLLSTERGLMIGTSASEHIATSSSTTKGITPDSITTIRQGLHGSPANQTPAQTSRSILFVGRAQKRVREMFFDFATADAFVARDMSILAEHLTSAAKTISGVSYQEDPDSILWGTRSDGTLLGFTFERDHEVFAWHRHLLGGSFDTGIAQVESVAVIPEPTLDQLWMIVKRTINGATKRYIEFFEDTLVHDTNHEEMLFVDSALSLNAPVTISAITQANPGVVTANAHGFSDDDVVRLRDILGMTSLNDTSFTVANKTANTFELVAAGEAVSLDTSGLVAYASGGTARLEVTSVTGLSHLEGEVVDIQADGAFVGQATVSSGAVTLDDPASMIHVGLPYTSLLKTLPIEPPQLDGGLQGRIKRADRAHVMFWHTQHAEVQAPGMIDFDPIIFSEGGDLLGEHVPEFTGIKNVDLDMEHDQDVEISLRCALPVNFSVLGITIPYAWHGRE